MDVSYYSKIFLFLWPMSQYDWQLRRCQCVSVPVRDVAFNACVWVTGSWTPQTKHQKAHVGWKIFKFCVTVRCLSELIPTCIHFRFQQSFGIWWRCCGKRSVCADVKVHLIRWSWIAKLGHGLKCHSAQ